MSNTSSDDAGDSLAEPAAWLEEPVWWRKPLIWAVLLGLLYLLREFFLIGFLTFLICFLVRSAVGLITRRLPAGHARRRRLESLLPIAIFLGVCLAIYGVGRYFVPQVLRQSRSLLALLETSSPQDVQNTLLANTVGAWQFRQQFGSPEDQRYAKGLQAFQASARSGEGLYQSFPRLSTRLRAEFEASYEQAQIQYLDAHQALGPPVSERFEQWLLSVVAPELFRKQRDYYVSRWRAETAPLEASGELADLDDPADSENNRDEEIRQIILADVKSDPVRLAEYREQWNRSRAIQRWAKFRNSIEYQEKFEAFYKARRKENPSAAPVDFAFFQTLSKAYPQGEQGFLAAVGAHYAADAESLPHERHDFESATKLDLGQQWWAQSHVADWMRDHAKSDGPQALAAVVGWVDRGLARLVRVPIQVATALLLSFFILCQWHSLSDGVDNLRRTRLRPVLDDVGPGIVALAKLIGKSLQGQAIIALLNAAFTLTALWLIGVQYKYVLALITFLFSFIPVVGVILSGIPMCLVAMWQPGGSIVMALQVVAAIAVIHMIEGMYLSPRIIGKIGHLHPVVVIAILLVAEHFFGMWGLILGAPVAIYVIQVVILDAPIPGVYEPTGRDSAGKGSRAYGAAGSAPSSG